MRVGARAAPLTCSGGPQSRMESLTAVFQAWLSGDPRRYERAAFYRDAKALMSLEPQNPRGWQLPGGVEVAELVELIVELGAFIRKEVVTTLGAPSGHLQVVAPYAAGVPMTVFVLRGWSRKPLIKQQSW